VPEDVSYIENGVRRFFEGASVGLLRSLQAHAVIGNLSVNGTPDPELFLLQPDPDGAFIPLSKTAARLVEAKAHAGMFVIAPLSLGYDAPTLRYVWVSPTSAPAQGSADFAVLCDPSSYRKLFALVRNPETGG
jgi:hypothetical protein